MKNFNEILSRVKDLNKNIIIRKAEITDADAFVELFNLNYKRKTNPEYFIWQFFNTPFPSAIFLAFEENELIGFYGVKIYDVSAIGKVGFAIDFLIHEKARKKGVAILLDEFVRDFCLTHNTVIISALPNQFGNAAFKALGYKTIAKIDTLSINLDGFSKDVLNTCFVNDKLENKASFYKEIEYLKWRFNNNPIYNYDKISLNEANFAFVKVFVDPVSKSSCGDIVHLNSENTENTLKIIGLCIEKMTSIGIKSLTIWVMPHDNIYHNLIEIGFHNEEFERYFCLREVLETDKNYLNFYNWKLEECDAEIY